ncbi:MAG: MarR family winged helix-turn-helix transcriptional regulator [Cyclobacteriaceae bacterium]
MKKNPNDIYSNYSFLLEKTSKIIRQYAKQQFRAQGFEVTIDQWAVLKILFEKGEMSQVELAALAHKDTPTLTRILDILSEKQLLSRKADDCDRRRCIICLTEDGEKTARDMLPVVRNIRMHAWKGLNEEDFMHFVRILNTIQHNLKS